MPKASGVRRARVRAFAKINLSLKVLGRRPDGFHEIRTVFQTIALADRLEFEYLPGSQARIELEETAPIPGNLVLRAAEMFFSRQNVRGRLLIRLRKSIPMGAGLGGGSSDAAAVLLTLPVITGHNSALGDLLSMGAELGSDVPFFLVGGTALGLGRGEELYPLPEQKARPVVVLAPPIHVSTPEAYRALRRPALTSPLPPSTLNIFRSFVWESSASLMENDFEAAVFQLHPELGRWRRKLERLGAHAARLSGSGAALFGVFPDRAKLQGALPPFRTEPLQVFSTTTLPRARYRALWHNCLREHAVSNTWPPQSRYAK
jgi:4-diphosphocytidyl-2-C-methyl-D-erythritol kinase